MWFGTVVSNNSFFVTDAPPPPHNIYFGPVYKMHNKVCSSSTAAQTHTSTRHRSHFLIFMLHALTQIFLSSCVYASVCKLYQITYMYIHFVCAVVHRMHKPSCASVQCIAAAVSSPHRSFTLNNTPKVCYLRAFFKPP